MSRASLKIEGKQRQPLEAPQTLGALRNIGKAMLADFEILGITSVGQLSSQNADELYLRLSALTRQRQDPCVHDTFAAAIHQAKTGEALDWWAFTPMRKARQLANTFPLWQGV
jgi:hypothetical protein